ncbi:MAG TPA: ABC transporter permease [Polyangia bacterium]|nr:ABC transporter permease [Polyangia bacterium]
MSTVRAAVETTAPEVAAPRPSQLKLNLATISVLVSRDLRRFFRQKSRVVGALVQPLIFWLVIGSGLQGSFRMPGADGVGYVQYFFPGIVMLVVLFTSIFTTMSVIEDRHKGFLQAVLVAPASRTALVLGKTLGGVAIALAQAALFLALMPLAGIDPRAVDWPLITAMLLLTSIGLSSMGFGIAWWLDSTQGYHVVMSVLLIPLWILSGAMFPLAGAARWIGWLMRVNPMSYGVAGIRRALYENGGHAQAGSSTALELGVVAGFALAATLWAAWMCNRRGSKP